LLLPDNCLGLWFWTRERALPHPWERIWPVAIPGSEACQLLGRAALSCAWILRRHGRIRCGAIRST
jgi:hypothetical protein